MKKKIIIIIVMVVILVLPIAILVCNKWYGEDILSGKYYIIDSEDFPNGYIEVKKDRLYIHNVDLNGLMRERQLELYYLIEDNPNVELKYGFSEEELEFVSNLNVYFDEYGYELTKINPSKEGTYEYFYACKINDTIFGVHIIYNSWKKTIEIVNLLDSIKFERK